jgi:molecular chaperone DnaJ
VLVNFPAGIDSGQRLRVPSQGMPGPSNAPAGDLYVDVEVAPHARFERDGADLITREQISFTDAVLGTQVEVELPDHTNISVKIPAGTQPSSVLTIEGKGLPRLDRRARGDVHVVVGVHVPNKLSRKARKLLEELAEELNPEAQAKIG